MAPPANNNNAAAGTVPAGRRGRSRNARLMRNVPIGTKMWVVVGAMVLPLVILMGLYAISQIKDLKFVSDELKGLEYYHPLEEIGGAINIRAALLAEALVTGKPADLTATDVEIASDIAEMDAFDAKFGRPASHEKWLHIEDEWTQLRGREFQDAAGALAAHQSFVDLLADLRVHIATEWGMALDPVAESYYALDIAVMRIPETQNFLGSVRGLLATAANGTASPETRVQMVRLAALMQDRINSANSELQVVKDKLAGNPDALSGFAEVNVDWSSDALAWANQLAATSGNFSSTSDEFMVLAKSAAELPDEIDVAHDQIMQATTTLMTDRYRGELVHTVVGTSVVLLMCALAVFLSHSVSWRIIGAIRRLREISSRIATGDFTNHIDAEGSDEMAQLYYSIHQMQEQLRADFEARAQHTREIRRMSGGLAATSASVMIADNDNKIIYLNDAARKMFGDIETELRKDLPAFNVNNLVGQNIDVFHKNPAHQRGVLQRLAGSHAARFIAGGKHIHFTASPVFGDEGERLGTVVEWVDQTKTVESEKEIDAAVDAFLKGDLSLRIKEQGKTGFYELIARKMNIVISGMAEIVSEVQVIVAEAGRGDLNRRVQVEGKSGLAERLGKDVNELVDVIGTVVDEVQALVVAANDGDLNRRIDTAGKAGLLVKIASGINDLTANMAGVVSQVKVAASEVHRGAEEISQGNVNLSQRTEQQASSLEETASSMEQMTSTVKQNADNAGQANQLAVAARDQAEKGGAVVARAVSAMGEINGASRKIADIIGVIDEIAFQTNLLALNAAVEAARAGEQGRGFAVVATEVRNLAGRSATAAKEIKALIQDSVHKVEEGSNLVTQSGATLEQIVGAVKKVTDIVAEIAAASHEQSSGIEQVNKAVMQLDELTQQNAALVEQASAASQSMAEQARTLNESMARYQVGDHLADAVMQQPAARQAPRPQRPKVASRARSAVASAQPAAAPAQESRRRAAGGDEAVWKEF
jgi:methyl-accepting chemotaxis protein